VQPSIESYAVIELGALPTGIVFSAPEGIHAHDVAGLAVGQPHGTLADRDAGETRVRIELLEDMSGRRVRAHRPRRRSRW
jgi:hypothetical protein